MAAVASERAVTQGPAPVEALDAEHPPAPPEAHAPRRPPPAPIGSRLRPTPAGQVVLYAATALLGLACAIGDERPVIVAGFLYGLVVASGLTARKAPRRLTIRRAAPDAVHAGEPFLVAYAVTSAERRRPVDGISIRDVLESAGRPASSASDPVAIPRVLPGSTVLVEGELTAFRRGRVRFGRLALTATPEPGLVRLVTEIGDDAGTRRGGSDDADPCAGAPDDEMLVLPRRGVIEARAAVHLLSRASEADLAPVARSSGEDEWRGLREYREGDPLRRVQWKLLARWPDRPMVREMEDARVREATVLLETFVPERDPRRLSRLERALSFAVALSDVLLQHGHRVRFRTFAPGPLAVDLAPGRGGTEDLARALAVLEPSRDRTIADLLAAEAGAGGALFVLSIGEPGDAAGGAPRSLQPGGSGGGFPFPGWSLPPGALPIGHERMRELMYYAS